MAAPMLTDSGGFQVFSLAQTRKIDEDGVTFKSHIDGSTHRFTPEKSIQIQENLGADIIMAFDECSDPNDHAYSRTAMERHIAGQSAVSPPGSARTRPFLGSFRGVSTLTCGQLQHNSSPPCLPGHRHRRIVGWGDKKRDAPTLDLVTPLLPENKPRYLMGVGTPEDLINGIARASIFSIVYCPPAWRATTPPFLREDGST